MRWLITAIILAICVLTLSCDSGRYSARGFRMPPGDAQRGQAAFLARGCNGCHTVYGVDLPVPKVQPPAVVVALGGPTPRVMTDGYLFTSVVHPSYHLAAYPSAGITVNGHSRMPSYADKATTQEIADIVEFLQAHYQLREIAPHPAFY